MTPPRHDQRLEPDDDDWEPEREREGPRDWQIAQDRYERWLDEINGSR